MVNWLWKLETLSSGFGRRRGPEWEALKEQSRERKSFGAQAYAQAERIYFAVDSIMPYGNRVRVRRLREEKEKAGHTAMMERLGVKPKPPKNWGRPGYEGKRKKRDWI